MIRGAVVNIRSNMNAKAISETFDYKVRISEDRGNGKNTQ